MDSKNKTIIKFIFLSLLFSCENEHGTDCDFYSKPAPYSDVSRFPIIEPFELITAYCCSDWHVGRTSKNWKIFNVEADIDSIGYKNRVIYIYDPVQKYFALDLSDSSMSAYNSSNKFYEDHEVKLFETEEAFTYYQKYGLPIWIKK